MFAGKTLLITGGTGSFGNAVLRRFLRTEIREIRVFSRDEKKQDEQRRAYSDARLSHYLGDTRDRQSVDRATRGVDFVFHAAALKQVPSCEFFPIEAVKTNILGTENVIQSAISAGVDRVVCLSTDKAVYPINAMGLSKALMEKVVVASSRNLRNGDTTICATRYGNVMGSRGSVIPVFLKQISEGLPLTITNPKMTRFMMSMDEAIDLVLFAFTNGRNGEIFVRKSPSATIDTLVNSLRSLVHLPNHPVDVIGTRHGEKLYEVLVGREEMATSEDLGDYFRLAPDARDLNYGMFVSEGKNNLDDSTEYSSHNTDLLDSERLMKRLINLEMVKLFMANGSLNGLDA